MDGLLSFLGFLIEISTFPARMRFWGLWPDRYDREAGRRQKPFDLDGVQAPPVRADER